MAIIADKREKEENVILTFPGMEVEKVQLCSGNYHWLVDLKNGTLNWASIILDADRNNVQEIRRALTVIVDYLKTNKENKEENEEEKGEVE